MYESEDGMKIRVSTAAITALVTFIFLHLIIPPLATGYDTTPSPVTPPDTARYQQEELRRIVAPIALYPDPLLAQIFMASTYPVDVVLASRWLKENKNLQGGALDSALQDKEWDASVKRLVHFPEVLFLLNDNLEWTNKLGKAFLDQRKELMEAAQYLRQRAKEEGNLITTTEQKVLTDDQGIRIEPASPNVVYVPAYNPAVVYGSWYYPATPWFVYPVSPWVYPVPYGFWWGYPSWVYCDVFVYDDDYHHDSHDDHGDHDGDHHQGGNSHDSHHNENYGKAYGGTTNGNESSWKRWQHNSTRARAAASGERGTVSHDRQSFVKSREGEGDLQRHLQRAPIRQSQGSLQTRSGESHVTAWEGRRDNRSYGLGSMSRQPGNFNRQAPGPIQSSGERIGPFRSSQGAGLGRMNVPSFQTSPGGRSLQGGSGFQGGGSLQRGGSFQGRIGSSFSGRFGGGGGGVGGRGFRR